LHTTFHIKHTSEAKVTS